MSPSHKGHGKNAWIYHGLSPEQKAKLKTLLTDVGIEGARHSGTRRTGDNPATGWFISRAPTTIHPPTWLSLVKRDENGKALQVIWITRDGVTR